MGSWSGTINDHTILAHLNLYRNKTYQQVENQGANMG